MTDETIAVAVGVVQSMGDLGLDTVRQGLAAAIEKWMLDNRVAKGAGSRRSVIPYLDQKRLTTPHVGQSWRSIGLRRSARSHIECAIAGSPFRKGIGQEDHGVWQCLL